MRRWSLALVVVSAQAWAQGAPVDSNTSATAAVAAEPRRSSHLLHLGGVVGGDLVGRHAQAELFGSYSLFPRWDLGGAVDLGSSVGARATATFHPFSPYEGLIPFAQARAGFNASHAGAGVGAGLAAGAWYEVGAGRITAGIAGELGTPIGHAHLGSVWLFAGYEMDWPGLQRKAPARTDDAALGMDLSDVKAAPTGELAAVILDSDGDPLRAQLGVSASADGAGKLYTVSPRLDAPLPEGDYLAIASADGFLTQGRSFRVEARSKASLEFRLRPAPETAHVALSSHQVRLETPIAFEPGQPGVMLTSYALLDEVVDLLLANPAIRLRIDVTAAGELALERAQAVMNYLVEHGVPHHRLSAVGSEAEKGALEERLQLDVLEQE